jgi:hypothetical protein
VGLVSRQPCKQSALRVPAENCTDLLANEGIRDLRFLAFTVDIRLPRLLTLLYTLYLRTFIHVNSL